MTTETTFTSTLGNEITIRLGAPDEVEILCNGKIVDGAYVNFRRDGDEIRLEDRRKACDIPASARDAVTEIATAAAKAGAKIEDARMIASGEWLSADMDRADSDH